VRLTRAQIAVVSMATTYLDHHARILRTRVVGVPSDIRAMAVAVASWAPVDATQRAVQARAEAKLRDAASVPEPRVSPWLWPAGTPHTRWADWEDEPGTLLDVDLSQPTDAPFEAIEQVLYVDASATTWTAMPWLAWCSAVRGVDLAWSDVRDIDWARHHPSLEAIDISDTRIDSIEPLLDAPCLRRVVVDRDTARRHALTLDALRARGITIDVGS
jgi:hypothetical protein